MFVGYCFVRMQMRMPLAGINRFAIMLVLVMPVGMLMVVYMLH
jgi:hypothetical protein